MLPTGRTAAGRRPPQTLPGFRNEINRLFEDFFERPGGNFGGFTPAADLYESNEAFVLEMELPGFTHDDVEVTIEQGVLTIRGVRRARAEESGETYHLRERASGRFSRSFALPSSVNADEVEASFEEGILTVDLPKASEAKPRKIEVNVG